MLIHPHAPGFRILHNDGGVVGIRHYVLVTQADFLIDPVLQRQAVELGNRVTHAWVRGEIVESLYGRTPPQAWPDWQDVTYRPAAGAQFVLGGYPVSQGRVFETVVCVVLEGHRRVLVPPTEKVETGP